VEARALTKRLAYSQVVQGIGYETYETLQLNRESGVAVSKSGDGTVPYQSLRQPAAWAKDGIDVEIHEIPGCDHLGVAMRDETFAIIKGLLGIGDVVAPTLHIAAGDGQSHNHSSRGGGSRSGEGAGQLKGRDVSGDIEVGRLSWVQRSGNNRLCECVAKVRPVCISSAPTR